MTNRSNMIPIAGRLHCVAEGEPVCGADEVLYEPEGDTPVLQKDLNERFVDTSDKMDFIQENEYNKSATTGTTGDFPYNGMGRVVIPKNIVEGVNTLTHDAFEDSEGNDRENTIYVIQYDFTLGEDITIPANCELEFDGGSLAGSYTLTGTNTLIEADETTIFSNVTIGGTWLNKEIFSTWFSDINEANKLQKLFKFTQADLQQTVYIRSGNYIINSYVTGFESISTASNTHIVLDGHIYIHSNNNEGAGIAFRIENVKNISITGHGIITGDREENEGTGEWGPSIYIHTCDNVTIENINLEKSFGDGIYFNGVCNNVVVRGITVDKARRNAVCISAGHGYVFENNTITNTYGTNPQCAIELETDGEWGMLEDVIIRNNYLYDNLDGVSVNANGSHIRNIVIENNTIETTREGNAIGIALMCGYGYELRRVYIRNNYIKTTFVALHVACFGVVIENNEIDGGVYSLYNTRNEIGSDFKIINNKIKGNGEWNKDNILFEYNNYQGTIQFNDSKNVKVRYNTFTSLNNNTGASIKESGCELCYNTIDASDVVKDTAEAFVMIGGGSSLSEPNGIKLNYNTVIIPETGDNIYIWNDNIKGGEVIGNKCNRMSFLFIHRYTYDDTIVNGYNIKGAFADKPSYYNVFYKGATYYDTTNNRYIYWNGTAWVDATGTPV